MPERKLIPGFSCYGIIDHCMLRCKMCRKWQQDNFVKQWTRPPSVEDWKRCTRQLSRIVDETFELNIGGGEALLYPGVLEVVRCAADNRMKTCIATNAYLIDRDMARRIADSGLTAIAISLDSIRAETHDYLRGVRGVFRRVMHALEYLKHYAPELNLALQCVIYDINKDEVLELLQWVTDNDMGSLNFLVPMQPNNTWPIDKHWQTGKYGYLWPKNIPKIKTIIDEIIALKKQGARVSNTYSQLWAFRSYYEDPSRFVKKRQCNLDRAVLVSSVGDIFLCFEFEKIGNIKEDNLADVWYSEKAARIRQGIQNCKKNCHILMNCFDEFIDDYDPELVAQRTR